MTKIIVVGEILVEIMADTKGDGFKGPIALTGPYASGAPAIFIDQVARMGHQGAIISTVGNDDFGTLCLNRLRGDGVDISAIAIDPDRPTGSAFVRYREDGSRDFVFNIQHSAAGQLPKTEIIDRALSSAGHFHVMGSSLSSPEVVALNCRAVDEIKARGGTVSFDPNLRKEILNAPGMLAAMHDILGKTDLFLPSGQELTLLTKAKDDERAIAELLSIGVKCLVHKLGDVGVRYHDKDGALFVPAFNVEELDPTGAGDCFGGAFTALWLDNTPIEEALTLAAAAGAMAVTRRGPMEGAMPLESLRSFVAAHRS